MILGVGINCFLASALRFARQLAMQTGQLAKAMERGALFEAE